ncbi:choline dehydrogenase [Penicillium viridicatum]|nr:choline dehydrogenase [Penicillium viridicatum]
MAAPAPTKAQFGRSCWLTMQKPAMAIRVVIWDPRKEYDVCLHLVGGGNAGLTIAARLAEGQSGSVAVVEAGTLYEIGNGNQSQVPVLDNNYISKDPDDWQPLIDWGYVTSPQKACTNANTPAYI